MPLFNVKPMIKFMEQMMVDTCKIERNARGEVFNTTTGVFDAGTITKIYQGQCSVSAVRTLRPTDRQNMQGDVLSLDVGSWLTLPLSFKTPILPKDTVTVLTSNNANLVGQIYIVEEDLDTSTYSASRRILMHRFTRIPS